MLFEENVPNERLRRARHLKGWTQSDLAEALGTDFETVSRWERGITVPSAYFRERLCSVLDKTPVELGLITDFNKPLAPSTTPCVFLAAAYVDAEIEFVTRLKAHLQAREITIISSRTLRRQGVENQRQALQEAIHTVKTVLLIVSPEARSSRLVQKALQIAGIYRSPICAVWIDGEEWQECFPSECGELFATLDARKRSDHQVFDEIVAMLAKTWLDSNQAAASITSTNESAESTIEPRNPYKGLKAFHSEDRLDFFGRDALVDELAETLNRSLMANEKHAGSDRLLAVVGPSGSGKSSVIMAGLLPRLQAGGLPGSQLWVYLDPIIPGVHPIEALALAFAMRLPDRSLKTIREDLDDDSTYGVHLLASSLGKTPETRVVLFIDQFEEVFTQTISEEERHQFLELLITAVSEQHGSTILILTLRADFYDRPMYYPELFQLIEAHHSYVLPMDFKELREAIERPAKLPDVLLTFEGDLVSDLLFEVQGRVGALPLLQFTLDQLFQRRSGHQLTLQAYREIGGVKGAVVNHAEVTYLSLRSEEHRKLARILFLRLIDPGATIQDTTRRRITLTELVLSNPKETVIMEQVTRAFTTARLLTTDTVSGVATVEVSHEAVIREWTRLADWLDEAREDVHLQQALSEDVAAWEQLGRPRDRFYRGSQLKEARAWARRNKPSGNEVAFLQASVASRTRFLISVIALLLIVVSSIGGTSWILAHQPRSLDPTLVSTLQDNGKPGSLRYAVDTSPPGSTITFDASLSGTIVLTSGDLNIAKNLTIHGPVARTLSVSSDYKSGDIVHVLSGLTVTISNLNFVDSTTFNNSFIFNEGTLTLVNSAVSGNTSIGLQGGGGIDNLGTLDLTNSTVSGDASKGEGGGIDNFGTLTVTNSTISGNTSSSTINFSNGDGGGIFNGGTLTMTNSTVSGNTSNGDGGGIFNGGMLTMTNSTLSGNTSKGGGGGIDIASQQPVVQFPAAQVDLIFTTIYDNKAPIGADIAIKDANSQQISLVIISNSIVTGDSAHRSPDISGMLTSNGYNLYQDTSSANFVTGIRTQQSTDKTLSANDLSKLFAFPVSLQYTGGLTRTLALAPNSPAVNAIPIASCHINGITTDQRGMKRPDGIENACDIGAFESSN